MHQFRCQFVFHEWQLAKPGDWKNVNLNLHLACADVAFFLHIYDYDSAMAAALTMAIYGDVISVWDLFVVIFVISMLLQFFFG